MAMTNEEKLVRFENEAMGDAQKACDEIREKIKSEFQTKVEAGEKKLFGEFDDFVQSAAEEIRKEKSMEISHASIEYWHEYLKYSDTIFSGIIDKVRDKIEKFLVSDGYVDYLKSSCVNIIDRFGVQIEILYMPRDEKIISELKSQLSANIGAELNFIVDEEIKIGGLRFRDTSVNILINDSLDEKIARSGELLTTAIGLLFKEANQAK